MTSVNPARVEVQKLIDIAKQHSAQKKRDAHKLWRAAAELSSQLLGANHEATLYCRNNVGMALVDCGNYDEAIPLLETALRQAQAIHGYVHYAVEHISQSLARAYKQTGDNAASYKHWMTAATSSQSLRGLNHSTTIFCLHQAARTLANEKRFEEALVLFQKVLAANKSMRKDSVYTAYAARDTATCLNQLERFQEALPLWRLSYRLFKHEPCNEKLADSTYRSLNWTRNEVKKRLHAEQLQVLAEQTGLSDEERQYLLGLRLTRKQLGAVLEHLKKTYLTGDRNDDGDGDYQYADNLRVAVKSVGKQVANYQELASAGCCGSEDVEILVVEDNGNKDTVMIGFNFGH